MQIHVILSSIENLVKFVIRRKSVYQYLCDSYSNIGHASGFLEKLLPLERTVSIASNGLDDTISKIVFLHPAFELIPREFLRTNILVCNLSLGKVCHCSCRESDSLIWTKQKFSPVWKHANPIHIFSKHLGNTRPQQNRTHCPKGNTSNDSSLANCVWFAKFFGFDKRAHECWARSKRNCISSSLKQEDILWHVGRQQYQYEPCNVDTLEHEDNYRSVL